jgi:hypothetical protein
MKSAALWGLGALNVILAIVLINRFTPENRAYGQARPSDYLMVPGQLQGVSTGVVFMVDTTKAELSAMSYDDGQNRLDPMPKIDLAAVFKAGNPVGQGPKVKPR